ncbi:hypothetical protein MEG1DRAFT_04341 [Photorhabdus temperata subsp. temperata Meg1]|uniref:Uncharacterized protein n=1 Tax=Photorhabdus temperata subsp. temperata Meg1 TaxID=1393735 RepID=A0A081RQW7_PHOTE|nr:hypothetical protein MEG1DRAFT_04341 [Photorhabdus temperata subsp. temperata Meg1]
MKNLLNYCLVIFTISVIVGFGFSGGVISFFGYITFLNKVLL